MELFQELLFTISFSFIVSLLIVRFFSTSSSCDDGNSKEPFRVEENIEKEWVVCDSEKPEKEGKSGLSEDPVNCSEDVEFECFGGELGSGVVIGDAESESVGDACYVFDESPERTEFNDAGGGLVESDEGNVVEFTGSFVQEDCVNSVDVSEVKIEEKDDDDWQGIETTELEKRFGAAVGFVDSKMNTGGLNLIDNEVKLELYGLHRVAIQGSCFEPQPMALKVSARANWNSWKRLENLGREDAMERYVALLSRHVPDWMGSHSSIFRTNNDMQL